ncbi:hypothetical protein DOTSEDRAFT_47244 [Dothistroma septosporum NZE10]|uniref:Beta-lactamase-related domain-containing protein n=1 Tax=Dothistroma septosporum (strain NZE10 / CBS 128990) TaxID=675120 RepID=N1PFX6_DOTSN|nr:hypothetical protein DOTSEDRAFT_47244 [Dothistroma septosporum NZE10]
MAIRTTRQLLQDVRGVIDEVRKQAGAPGLAYGVIHNGSIIYEDFFGFRDVEQKLAPDRDTLFLVASLTKAMSATAVAKLVDKGLLSWETPVHEILPELSKDSKLAMTDLNIVDVLCHRTGKAWCDALYLQSNNNMMLPKSEALRTFDYLPMAASPRTRHLYNNHAYNLVGFVLERLFDTDYGTLMRRELFEPLTMSRTYTEQVADENAAKYYNILTDKSAYEIPACATTKDTIMFAGQSVRTSLGDLLKLYGSYLTSLAPTVPRRDGAATVTKENASLLARFGGLMGFKPTSNDVSTARSTDFPPLPVKDVLPLTSGHIRREENSVLEQSYGLGWCRTQLPGKLDFAWNRTVVDQLPVLGASCAGKLVIWHGGNMPGTTAAVCMLPETSTAVVVLQNSLGLCDAADWTCQLVLDVLFAGKPMQDYPALSAQAATNTAEKMNEVEAELEAERIPGTQPRELSAYVGTYYNSLRNWSIAILLDEEGQLQLRLQSRDDEEYLLRHYHYDTFVWNLSYDEMVKRAQYIRPAHFYKFAFEASNQGSVIDRLRWQHDPEMKDGELFVLDASTRP